MVAGRLANMRQGARSDLSPIGERSQAAAAELLNVGKRSVERARQVQAHGAPDLVAAVDAGKIAVSTAAEIATLPEDEQKAIIEAGDGEIQKAAKKSRKKKTKKNADKRAMVAAELANMSVGRNWANLPDKTSSAAAADMLSISERALWSAKRVQSDGAWPQCR